MGQHQVGSLRPNPRVTDRKRVGFAEVTVQGQPTGGVRPNASENSQISPSNTVQVAPKVAVVVRDASLSCSNAKKEQKFTPVGESSGGIPANDIQSGTMNLVFERMKDVGRNPRYFVAHNPPLSIL
jgi:hypothetical protein